MQNHFGLVEVPLDRSQLVGRRRVLIGSNSGFTCGIPFCRVLSRVPPRVVAELPREILQSRGDDAKRGAGRVVRVGERDADDAVGVVRVAEVVLVLDGL